MTGWMNIINLSDAHRRNPFKFRKKGKKIKKDEKIALKRQSREKEHENHEALR